jgi:DNA-directed RNA polymerase subunit RPC12/RpoP
MTDEPTTVTPPTCAECGRPWLDAAERWRSRLTIDDEAAFYCPECDEREFVDG